MAAMAAALAAANAAARRIAPSVPLQHVLDRRVHLARERKSVAALGRAQLARVAIHDRAQVGLLPFLASGPVRGGFAAVYHGICNHFVRTPYGDRLLDAPP